MELKGIMQENEEKQVLVKLGQLEVKVDMMLKSIDSIIKKMDDRDLIMDKLSDRLTKVEGEVKENSKFRWWVITSVIGSLFSIIITLLTKLGIL